MDEVLQPRGNAFAMEELRAGPPPAEPIPTGGQPIPDPVQKRLKASFGEVDLSKVKVQICPDLANAGVHAVARGDTIFAASSRILGGSDEAVALLAHELTHLLRQAGSGADKAGETDPDPAQETEAQQTAKAVAQGEPSPVQGDLQGAKRPSDAPAQCAGPLIHAVIWGGKALAATTLDHFIDFAIAALLGLPGPGLVDDAVNLLLNLVPYLGEAKKVKKIAKLFEVVDKVADFARQMKHINIPGASHLFNNISRESDKLRLAIEELDLSNAKAAFGRLIGYVREGQVAAKAAEGGTLMATGLKKLRNGFRMVTDIDVVFKQGGQTIFGQVKALGAAVHKPGTKSWDNFVKQAENTLRGAEEYAKLEGTVTKVVYYVDDISTEASAFLKSKGIDVIMNANFLH